MLKIEEIASHRNGVSGNGFYIVTFHEARKHHAPRMVAVVFLEQGNCAVFDRELLGQGVIAFGRNSWRGDNYERELREAIAKYEEAR